MERCADPMGWDGFLTLCLYELEDCRNGIYYDLKFYEFAVVYCCKVIEEELCIYA